MDDARAPALAVRGVRGNVSAADVALPALRTALGAWITAMRELCAAPLTFGSLFAGIGGLDLGLEQAGWHCRWQVETQPYCLDVLTRHWPHIPKYHDIRTVHGNTVEPITLLVGGFPCQPVSAAGQQKAQADARWLWPEFSRLICELRPCLVLVENVTGLLARGMGDVLGALAASGYDAEWDCLPASAFGAPHRRDRVFILAYARSARLEGVQHPQRIYSAQSAPHPVRREWPATPRVSRRADGLSDRVDRTRALGNAVVPAVAEWLGHRLCGWLTERTD